MPTPLTLYGTVTASGTVATACTLVTGTGATVTSKNTLIGTSTGYGEIWSQGNAGAWPALGALGGIGPHGWLLDTTLLENNTLVGGNFTPTFDLSISIGSITADLYERVYVRSSGAVYTQIGTNLVKSGVTLTAGFSTYTWPATSLPNQAFGVGDKLYRQLDMHILTNSTGSGSAVISVRLANSASLGFATAVRLVTQGYTAGGGGGGGGSVVGSFGVLANGTGVASFDHFRAVAYPDASLSLGSMGRIGSSFFGYNATLPSAATTLGLDLSTDGVNFTDMTLQNGGSIPGINAQLDPVVDLFNVDTSANYTSTVGYGGSVASWVYDFTNSRITATNGARGVYLYSALAAANVDVIADMDKSDAGGLVWCYSDSADYYSLAICDNAAVVGTPNTLTLYKTVGGVQSQLVQTPISFLRGTFHRFRATTLGGVITISMDGAILPAFIAQDTFTRPNQSGSWGVPSDNESWAFEGGTGTLAISGNEGTITGNGTFNFMHFGTQTGLNVEGLVRIAPGNANDLAGILLHYGSFTDFYRAYITTGSSNNIVLQKRVANITTTLQSGATGFTINTGSFYWLRFRIFGALLQARAWADGSGEPTTWQVSGTDSSQGAAGFALEANPAGATAIQFDNFTINPYPAGTENGVHATYVDASPLPAGQAGLINNAGIAARYAGRALSATLDLGLAGVGTTTSRYYQFWCQQQGDYVGGTPQGDAVSGTFVYTRQRLATTDSTVSPQVLDMTVAAYPPNIGAGTIIPTADYRYTFIDKNLADLAKQSNYEWTIDETKTLNFNKRQVKPAPWILQSSTIAPISDLEVDTQLIVEVANDQYRNRQVLLGVLATIPFTVTITGNGQASSFPLPYPLCPHCKPPIILLNGRAVAAAQKGTTGADWYYDVQPLGDPIVSQDSNGAVLTNTDVMTVTGTGVFSTTLVIDNIPAQQALAAIEGGTGIVEAVEDVTARAMDVPTATTYANQLLARFGVIGRTFTFTTYRNGLDVGQLLPIFLPEMGVWNGQFLLSEVDISLQTQPNNTVLYKYLCTASEIAYAGSWQKLFASGLLQ